MARVRGIVIGSIEVGGHCAEIVIEPRDLWTGLFWDIRGERDQELHGYWCAIPGLVLHTVVDVEEVQEVLEGHTVGTSKGGGKSEEKVPDKVEAPEVGEGDNYEWVVPKEEEGEEKGSGI